MANKQINQFPISTTVVAADVLHVNQSALDRQITAANLKLFTDQTGAEITSLLSGEPDTNTFTDSEKTKLGTVETNAKDDQTDAEIEIAYNAQVGVVTQVDAEAGISVIPERWTPQRVKQAVEALTTQQVIQTHVVTTSSQALVGGVRADIAGITATITLKSITSRVKVEAKWEGEHSSVPFNTVFGINRDGTPVGNPASAGNRPVGISTSVNGFDAVNSSSTPESGIVMYIDSPTTTSPITYTMSVLCQNTQTLYNNRTVSDNDAGDHERLTSTIILTEIL